MPLGSILHPVSDPCPTIKAQLSSLMIGGRFQRLCPPWQHRPHCAWHWSRVNATDGVALRRVGDAEGKQASFEHVDDDRVERRYRDIHRERPFRQEVSRNRYGRTVEPGSFWSLIIADVSVRADEETGALLVIKANAGWTGYLSSSTSKSTCNEKGLRMSRIGEPTGSPSMRAARSRTCSDPGRRHGPGSRLR